MVGNGLPITLLGFRLLVIGKSRRSKQGKPVSFEVGSQPDVVVAATIAFISCQDMTVTGDVQFHDARLRPRLAQDISDDGCHPAGHAGEATRMQLVD